MMMSDFLNTLNISIRSPCILCLDWLNKFRKRRKRKRERKREEEEEKEKEKEEEEENEREREEKKRKGERKKEREEWKASHGMVSINRNTKKKKFSVLLCDVVSFFLFLF